MLPPALVDGVLSPMILGEIVLGALLDSGSALVLPTVILGMVIAVLAWKVVQRRAPLPVGDAGRRFLPDWLTARIGRQGSTEHTERPPAGGPEP